MSEPIYSALSGTRNIDAASAAEQGASTRIFGDGGNTGNGIPGGLGGIQRDCGDSGLCFDGPTGRLVAAGADFSRQAGVNSALEWILTTKATQVPRLVSSAVPYAFLDREPDANPAGEYHVPSRLPMHYPSTMNNQNSMIGRPVSDTRKGVYRQAGVTAIGSAGPVRGFINNTKSNVNAYENAMAQMNQSA